MSETRAVVYHSLRYVSEVAPAIVDRVADGMTPRELSRNLLSNMRTSLSVPSMFASMRIMRRLQMFVDLAADAYDAGVFVFDTPKLHKKNNVDYTVRCIYNTITDRLYDKHGESLEYFSHKYNPYRNISLTLDTVIAYVAKKQFGIKIK